MVDELLIPQFQDRPPHGVCAHFACLADSAVGSVALESLSFLDVEQIIVDCDSTVGQVDAVDLV